MPSRPKKPPATKMVPGGSYMAVESAESLRKRLEASIGHRVTIPVTDDKIGALSVRALNVGSTHATCMFTDDDRSLIVVLGEKDDGDKSPVILLDKLTPNAR